MKSKACCPEISEYSIHENCKLKSLSHQDDLLQIVLLVLAVPFLVTSPALLPQIVLGTIWLTGAVALLAPGIITQSYPMVVFVPLVP